MSTSARLSLFAAVMAVVFATSFVAGRAFIPESAVSNWNDETGVIKEHGAGEAK